ncbi:Phosphatase YidA [Bacteroidales bacterium Barb6XT]|nr:Phosphatase YidA [Bacteroidales bacterium Barb6XT]
MKYKLLVLDIDGTLLNDSKVMTSGTLTALLKVQQAGVRIVLASGRPAYGVLPIAKALEMDKYGGFIMSYNGGQILNAQSGEILFEKKLDAETVSYVQKKAKKRGVPVFTYANDLIVTDAPENAHVLAEAALNKMRVAGAEDFTGTASHEYVLVSDDNTVLSDLYVHWKKRLNGVADVFFSEPFFLEIVPPSVNKGDALSFLKDALQVKTEEVIAFGDGVCDIPMLQLAGTGIAMGNANDAVKSCADHITLSNEEEGVAAAIEKHIVAELRITQIPLDELNLRAKHALMGNLGIQYTYASTKRIEATMPVDERTRQPFGILHGGATLALAETVAGLGSMIIGKPDDLIVGMQVSGNHISSASEGDTVRAVATIIHKGRSSHVWDVNVYTSTDKLVSTVRVVNSVIKKR